MNEGKAVKTVARNARRGALAAAAAVALGWLLRADAKDRAYRIGFVANTIPVGDLERRASAHPAPRLLEDGLRERGWQEGRNIQFLWRSAESRYERLPAIFEELARAPVDVLVVFGTAEEAVKATSTIPIVMVSAGSPLDSGLAKSYARPGGNVTGMAASGSGEMTAKRLALLKEAVPGVTRVAFLVLTARTGGLGTFAPATEIGAAKLGISLFREPFELDKLDEAFASAVARGANAVLMPDWAELHWTRNQQVVHELAIRHKLPVMHGWPSAAESGGLMAYGVDDLAAYRRLAYFVDRILRGARPSELPIEQPSVFRFLVNVGAARRIGLVLPHATLLAADRVIE